MIADIVIAMIEKERKEGRSEFCEKLSGLYPFFKLRYLPFERKQQ
jgi:hypothetical protein